MPRVSNWVKCYQCRWFRRLRYDGYGTCEHPYAKWEMGGEKSPTWFDNVCMMLFLYNIKEPWEIDFLDILNEVRERGLKEEEAQEWEKLGLKVKK